MIVRIYLWLRKYLLKIDDRSQLEIAIANGLKIGKDYAVMGECIIDPGHCWLIEIGDRVTLAPRVHILAHDASTKRPLGFTVISRVFIGNDVFIGAGSIILGGAKIGNNVIIGAGSVVTNTIPDNSVAVGNPARVICTMDNYLAKRKLQMENSPRYDSSFKIGEITMEKKEQMIRELDECGIGFIV